MNLVIILLEARASDVRSQHILFGMTSSIEIDPALLTSLTNFVKMLLREEYHHNVIFFFFGGSLIDSEKKSGGIFDQLQLVKLCAELLPNVPTILHYHPWAVNYYPYSSD